MRWHGALFLPVVASFTLGPASRCVYRRRVGLRKVASGHDSQPTLQAPERPGAGPAPVTHTAKATALAHWLRQLKQPAAAMLVAFAMLRGGAPAHARAHSKALYNPDSAKGKYMDGSKKSVQTMKKRQKEKEEWTRGVGIILVTPLVIARTLKMGQDAKNEEKERVTTAIERMQIQMDEFMNVQGEATSDADMFASLRERASEMSDEEIFDSADQDGDGVITAKELGTLARALGKDSVGTLDDNDSFSPLDAPASEEVMGSSSGDDTPFRGRSQAMGSLDSLDSPDTPDTGMKDR